jgi:ParB/RepB/Spo0J family partition protein
MPELRLIPLQDIDPPEIAARETMDDTALRELADDIAANGLHSPIGVFVNPGNCMRCNFSVAVCKCVAGSEPSYRYEIIFGHRRYEAHRLLQKFEVQCLVWPSKPDNVEAIKLSENLCREDLNDGEVAVYLAELWEKHGYTEEQLCAAVRKSADWVGDRLRLFKGDPAVLEALKARKINFGVARELNKCSDDQYRNMLLHQAIESGCAVRVVTRWITDWKVQQLPPGAVAAPSAAPPEGAAPLAAPAAAPTPVNACWCCGGTNFPWTIHFKPIHEHCEQAIMRALNAPPAEG